MSCRSGRSFDPNSNAPMIATLLCAALIIYTIGVITGAVHKASKPQEIVEVKAKQTRPQSCEHLMNDRQDRNDEWNEEAGTYPLNHAWMDCMGVGIK